jgi:prepilin-type N-terminal cleavage/methylation domain-containing protein
MVKIMRQRPLNGFSLIELSIVLVILGLLTGGILAGQSLIRAAELRAVNAEYQRYTTAVGAFRDKYFALPGDMATATKFWGTASACPGTSATPSTGAATCDGDGNGLIRPDQAANSNEIFRAWQHMANAGLIEGNYSGVANSSSMATSPGSRLNWNIPASKLSNAGWSIYAFTAPMVISDPTYFEGSYGNFFFFGGVSGNVAFDPILKPEEAWNIDKKFDDGRPSYGSVRTLERDGNTTSTGCTNQDASTSVSVQSTSDYALANTGKNCSLMITTSY